MFEILQRFCKNRHRCLVSEIRKVLDWGGAISAPTGFSQTHRV